MKGEFQKVCFELGLLLTSDFGIINANGNRTLEFINYIEENQNLPRPIRYTYVELVLASMNESILKKIVNKELEKRFRNYIIAKVKDEKWYPQFDYWVGIKSKDEYPVGFLIEKISNEIID